MSRLADQIEERVEQLMAQQRIPGVAVGVSHRGEETRVQRGVTNTEHPLPIDEHTLFQVASNSKTFTATLVARLVQDGELDLDEPVSKILPEFRLADPNHTDRVSVRHLLCHRVGWDGDALFVRPPRPAGLTAIFEPMAKARQLVEPGTAWTYSNAAFSVAGRLLEVKTGKSFPQLLRDQLLTPLGMQHTFTDADRTVTHRVAAPHLSGREVGPVVLRRGGWQPGWEIEPHDTPAAGMVTCVHDLMRWLRFQLGSLEGVDNAPLGRAMLERTREPQLEPYNATHGQAMGWAIWRTPAGDVLNHGGLTAGYCTYTAFLPEHELAFAILTNSTAGGVLHTRLAEWLIGETTGQPVVKPEPLGTQPALAPYLGSYNGSFGLRSVTAVDGELEIRASAHSTEDGSWQPPAAPTLRARFCDEDRLVVVEPEDMRGVLLEFGRSNGEVRWLRAGGRIHTRA
jgi:CubicO group peptidase (beta-lactamase class C family)